MKTFVRMVVMLCFTAVAAGCADLEGTGFSDDGSDGMALEQEATGLTAEGYPIEAQSTTGPTPPRAVLERDQERRTSYSIAAGAAAGDVIIDNVPSYEWRHGCGPTALGMVVGYYDAAGYDLIPGDASTQTDAVDQAIASGGDSPSSPFPPGSEGHFEDHSMPIDDGTSSMLDDAYITAGRTPHEEDCIADYMDTSKSTRSNRYGWSWSTDIVPAFLDYVDQVAPGLTATASTVTSLTWEQFTSEMDNNQPMVFLVDTDGSGGTDHFITVIGYRESPTRQYASRDTWGHTIRWEDFAPMGSGQPWGIWGGFTFSLGEGGDHCEDGVVSGDETDVDCGGSCDGCPLTWNCIVNSDCQSDYCLDGRCQMKAVDIPGRLEAEYYFAASDTTMGNQGDRECDHIGNVDAELTSDVGGGCNVGWTVAGEYMDYEVFVHQTQAYDITARLASQFTGRSLHVKIDGIDVTGPLIAPSNGWQSFEDRVAENVIIQAGSHTVRIYMETDYLNINYLDFEPSNGTGCGNGVCDASEDCETCPEDCGECPVYCPNGVCDPWEGCDTCPQDCGECPSHWCGDGTCDPDEDCETCPGDCGECPVYCPNGVCDPWEGCDTCPEDCGECPSHWCGDGACDPDEDCETCPADCGECPTGGCTCPSGCDAVVDASVSFTKDGADNTCYFFNGSAGSYINSWNMVEVDLNGQDITNSWIGSVSYPAQSDGGYYLYVHSTVPWAHVEVMN